LPFGVQVSQRLFDSIQSVHGSMKVTPSGLQSRSPTTCTAARPTQSGHDFRSRRSPP